MYYWRENMNNSDNELIDWWVTVILAFFPIIVSIIISILRFSGINLERMIGDGELIISAFAISASSLINHYNQSNEKSNYKLLFYCLLIASFLQIVAYTTIKTNDENTFNVVLIISIFCVVSSVFVSHKSEKKFIDKEGL